MWFYESSLAFPSNFGMPKGNFVGILGHVGSCLMISLISLTKFRRIVLAMSKRLMVGIVLKEFMAPTF